MLLLSDGWKPMKYYDFKTGKINNISTVEVRVDGKFRRSDNKRFINVCTKSRQYPEIYVQNNKKRVKYLVHVSILSTFGNIKDINGLFAECSNLKKGYWGKRYVK